MRLEALESHARGAGPLQRLDPRAKLLATLGFVVAVVATPPGAWSVLGAEAMAMALVVGLSGLPPGAILRRWLALSAPVVGLGVLVAAGHPARAELGFAAVAGSIVARNSLAVVALVTLAGTTPLPRLLSGLRRLGAPSALVATLHFMSRYLHVLADGLARMLRARRARTFRRRGKAGWSSLAGAIGALFVRSAGRGERVHMAMLARGWDGTIRTLDDDEP